MLPVNTVNLSDQTTTFPPFPASVASALIVEVASTSVAVAVGVVPPPCTSPPTKTVPPPAAPEASTLAPISATLSPVTPTFPPTPPALLSETTIFTPHPHPHFPAS